MHVHYTVVAETRRPKRGTSRERLTHERAVYYGGPTTDKVPVRRGVHPSRREVVVPIYGADPRAPLSWVKYTK